MASRALRQFLAVCLSSSALGCGSSEASAPPVEECSVTAPTECSQPELSYASVEPIFHEHCAVCHGVSEDGPWPLDRYQDIADWADIVRDELVRCSMPPAGPLNTLSNRDRLTILDWLRCGLSK